MPLRVINSKPSKGKEDDAEYPIWQRSSHSSFVGSNDSQKQLQSSRVNALSEVLLFAICTFAIMVTAQTWFVHDVLNVP